MQGRVELLCPLSKDGSSFFIFIEGTESDPSYWREIVDSPLLEGILKLAKQRVVDSLLKATSGSSVYSFGLGAMRENLNGLAHSVQVEHPDEAIVSLSSVYCNEFDAVLEINRMVTTDHTSFPTAGARPYNPSIAKQIAKIRQGNIQQKFIIVDDVCFHGQTALSLRDMGFQVADVVSGVVTSDAIERLTPEGIRIHPLILVGDNNDGFIDTCPLHDFIPFAPLAGKTIGSPGGAETIPFIVERVSFSHPYMLPYLGINAFKDQTSLPVDRAEALSRELLENAVSLFESLDKLRGSPITAIDLAMKTPRLSYPVPTGRDDHDILFSRSVVEILKEDLDSLNRRY